MKHLSLQENLTYLVVWAILFMTPLLSMYMRVATDSAFEFDWFEVFIIWRKLGLFLLLFLVHNYLLAPLLLNERKRMIYFVFTACIVVSFSVFQYRSHPDFPRPEHHFRPMPPEHDHHPDDFDFRKHEPRPFFSEHDIVSVILLILMFGMNLGTKNYFRSREDKRKLIKLEKENLMQQLEYLKYQLNPHFLMNTLNNIHALIDIDSAQAQQAVIQLSKILRYVLYESNKEQVTLSQELEFMKNYVELMKMRYTDKLLFSMKDPEQGTGLLVAPLVFISFVENAFKHGVSYQEESFIGIEAQVYEDKHQAERLRWICRNSKHQKSAGSDVPSQGGVGLANVRQRLNLIYGNDYSLNVSNEESVYEVELDIPLNKQILTQHDQSLSN